MEVNFEQFTPFEEEEIKRNVLLTTLEQVKAWARTSSMWPLTFGLACCGIEMMAAGGSHFDLDRFGVIFRAKASRCDDCRWYGDEKNGSTFKKII
jgi:NADH-quinone oxidoreductase subunit B